MRISMLPTIRSRFRAFWQKWRGHSSRPPIRIDFYTRNGCCLCDEALEQIASAGRRYLIDLKLVDVDQSPELREEHGACVPVVAVNGRVRFRGRVNRVLLERLLRAESKNHANDQP
jgi:hypothetical protein